MSANSLYGRISAELAADYQHKSELFHRHSHLINRFGEAIKPHRLTPHVNPAKDGHVALAAVSNRGDAAGALLLALRARDAAIGEHIRPLTQLDDGFVIWTAEVLLDGIDFTLVFYRERSAP